MTVAYLRRSAAAAATSTDVDDDDDERCDRAGEAGTARRNDDIERDRGLSDDGTVPTLEDVGELLDPIESYFSLAIPVMGENEVAIV